MRSVKFSKIIVAAVVILNSLFAAAVLYAFIKTGSEPVVLIGSWFAYTTGELLMLSKIKRSEVDTSKEETNNEDII